MIAMARIFLCHASEDKPQVREVYQRLKALGFEPWLDEEDILPGQDWDDEIETALEQSAFVMVFLSKRSVEKVGYVQREFRWAMYRSEEMPEGSIHTIPIKLDDCTVPRRFRRHQWANLSEDGAFDRIVRALHYGLEQRGEPVPEPTVATPPQPPSAQPTPERPRQVEVAPPRAAPPEIETITNDLGMTFVRIPAGAFWMGTSAEQVETLIRRYPAVARDWFEAQAPQHRVTISQPFYLGIHPVTQAQWQAVMGNNPSRFEDKPDHPVEHVSWDEVQRFLQRLNERRDGHTYALPSEAQWEYACRAGSSGAYCFGDDEAQLGDYAWYGDNSDSTTHPVGQKQPNAWGLYDMHGNVWEWVQDWYGKYTADSVTDPSGPDAGAVRVFRGGCWSGAAQCARSALRFWLPPGCRGDYLGFRCLSSGVSQ
jgi:formylglycine-generating enzyme required for sulfatase activity